MAESIIKKTQSGTLRYIIGAAAIMIILIGLKWSAPFLSSIIFAFTLTLLAAPLVSWLEKKSIPRGFAVALVSILIVAILVVFGAIVLSSLKTFVDKLPEYQILLQERLEPLAATYGLKLDGTFVSQFINQEVITQAVLSLISMLVVNAFDLFFFLLTLILMIAASEGIVKSINKKLSSDSRFKHDFKKWSEGIQTQYRVQTVDNMISGTIATGIFFFMGIDFAIMWGVLTFILSYIPNIGIIIAGIPPVLIAFILYGTVPAIITMVLLVALNVIMDNAVTPRFMGKELFIPAIFVFIAFLFWSFIFGPLGAFISMPITLGLRSALAASPSTKFLADLLTASREDEHGKE